MLEYVFLAVIVGALAIAFALMVNRMPKPDQNKSAVLSTKDFASLPSFSKRKLRGISGGHYLEVDTYAKRVAVGQAAGILRQATRCEFDFSEIIEVSVVRDGVTATTVNKGSLAGRALVGGVVMGGLGTLIGALTASSTSRENVSRLALRIRVSDLYTPLHEVVLFDLGKKGLDSTNVGVMHMISEAATFCAILENAMLKSQNAKGARDITPLDKPKQGIDLAEVVRLRRQRDSGDIDIAQYESAMKAALAKNCGPEPAA